MRSSTNLEHWTPNVKPLLWDDSGAEGGIVWGGRIAEESVAGDSEVVGLPACRKAGLIVSS